MKQIDTLYRKHNQDIYKYLLHLTHNPSLSEDLLQETFIKAISSISTFKGNSSIKTWLIAIARNLWMQNLRNKKHYVEYTELLENYVIGSIDEKLITKEIANRIIVLLSKKDERTQIIVNMRIEGFSYFEISNKVDISENSARVIDFRTKKWIRNTLVKEGLI